VLIAIAFGCLAQAFLANDFSVSYVAQHSNTQLPTLYRFSAVWGGHEGSLLLWVLMLAGWGAAVSLASRQLPEIMVARVLAVLGLVGIGLLAFILFTSNPFDRLLPAAAEGRDLNPVAAGSRPGVPSAHALHGLCRFLGGVLLRHRGADIRPARCRLGALVAAVDHGGLGLPHLGIALGSWWAYYELGWGGWWFWDPVENASFMPWLVGTALIHSLAVTEKRGAFKNWTVLLAIAAFSLSLLGTFLVRSGVLTSVHAFASDPRRGIFILALLVVVVGSSLTLFAWRAPKVSAGGVFGLVSRETMLLMNNVLLVVATGSVLLGTLYPLLIDALGMGKLSVGPPYFNAVFVPVMVPLLLLMAVGPMAHWKHADLKAIARRLRVSMALAVAAGIAFPLLMGAWTPLTAMSSLLAVWIVASGVFQIMERLKTGKPTASFWGMHIAHFGIAVFVIGVAMVGGYQEEKDVRMEPGDTVQVGGYGFRLVGVKSAPGPNYRASVGTVELSRDGKVVKTMHPEKRNYFSSQMPMTEAAIDAGFTRDVYVSLGEPLDNAGAWSVRVYYKPFVDWIWGGCLLMGLGGIIAMLDRRYRLRVKSAAHLPGGVPA
jgi:cytochrome c-type biogenesis protein CcmF